MPYRVLLKSSWNAITMTNSANRMLKEKASSCSSSFEMSFTYFIFRKENMLSLFDVQNSVTLSSSCNISLLHFPLEKAGWIFFTKYHENLSAHESEWERERDSMVVCFCHDCDITECRNKSHITKAIQIIAIIFRYIAFCGEENSSYVS